jgi:aspartate carbamoyltransferase catalytic subunit
MVVRMDFRGRNIISSLDFTREEVEHLLNMATHIENNKEKYAKIAEGKILATLFFEPSTRTRLSFETSILRLGGNYIGFSSEDVSSTKKGETLADTIKTIANYADLIVMRHSLDGAAKLASKFSKVPIINAGSGSGEHPTQSLLDLLTIRSLKGKIDGLSIGLIGDLKNGRTTHSLSYLLSLYNVNLYFISPDALSMQYRVKDILQRRGCFFKETNKFKKTLPELDVIYMTRVQKERFSDPEEYENLKNSYILEEEDLKIIKEDAIILHPLPRVNEISAAVDKDPRAKYFEQTYYGVMLRKALLAMILGLID